MIIPELKGKSAIITGSTSGIGFGFATGLAQMGVNVMLNGFGDTDDIAKKKTQLSHEHNVDVQYHNADMTKPDQIKALVETAQDAFGTVDILINNAGIQKVSPIEEFPETQWDAIIAINLSSAFHTIKYALPLMKSRTKGRIINLASIHGLVASPFKSAYVAAKHGLVGLTKTVALEVAEHGITCNAICPGYVETPLVAGQIADTAKSRGISEEDVKRDILLKAQPTKQFITYAQLNGLLYYLCSDAGAGTNGAALTVDGGWAAQ